MGQAEMAMVREMAETYRARLHDLSWFMRVLNESLVEWTGRLVHPAKRGCIPDKQPSILARMGIDGEAFIALSAHFLKEFGSAVGAPAKLIDLCERRQTKFLHGMRAARQVFGQCEARRAA